MVKIYTQLDNVRLTQFARKQMWLSIKCKGIGLWSLFDSQHAEFIVGMIQGITPLLDQRLPSNILLKGRLNTTSIEQWLGKPSFNRIPTPKSTLGNYLLLFSNKLHLYWPQTVMKWFTRRSNRGMLGA